jgi:poly(hydroxyalkanoate) depolymerase family esterase
MPKSLTQLLLKSLRRMGKAQQAQGTKLLKSLLPKLPKPARVSALKLAKPKPVKRVAPARPAKTGAAKSLSTPKSARAGTAPASSASATGLPGKWQKFYFSQSGAGLLAGGAAGQRMLYWLYLPSGAAAVPRPLVVMLHGCQQTAEGFAASTRMNALAERKGFAVLYPQQSLASDSHRCWHWYKRTTQQGLGDIESIAALIAQVQARHRLDVSRTYAAGISAGAALAAILALRCPQLIAAVGLHSAPVYGTSDSPMSGFKTMQQGASAAYRESAQAFFEGQPQFPGMPVMLVHGKRDAVVRPINADQLMAQFVIVNGALITSPVPVQRRYEARHGGSSPRRSYQTATYYAGRKPQLVKCEIDSLGHAWSGGDGQAAFSAPGGPDATLLMWTFFSRQQRVPLVIPAVRAPAKPGTL